MAKNFYYTSPLIDQIRKELKGQLGDNLTDLVEALIDEKIKIGYENAEKKFLVYLAKKKDI
jgi:hypothetical protein